MKTNRLLIASLITVFSSAISVKAEEVSWLIDGDSAKHDLGKKIVRYVGNARFENKFYLIKGDSLESLQSDNTKGRYVKVAGSPATVVRKSETKGKLSLSAEQIDYQERNRNLTGNKNVQVDLETTNGSLKLKGSFLQIVESVEGLIAMQGAPAQLMLNQTDGSAIEATAKIVEFDQSNQIFTIQGDVVLKTERESISAGKIIYDMKNKTLEIPKIPNQRAKMIQKVKS